MAGKKKGVEVTRDDLLLFPLEVRDNLLCLQAEKKGRYYQDNFTDLATFLRLSQYFASLPALPADKKP